MSMRTQSELPRCLLRGVVLAVICAGMTGCNLDDPVETTSTRGGDGSEETSPNDVGGDTVRDAGPQDAIQEPDGSDTRDAVEDGTDARDACEIRIDGGCRCLYDGRREGVCKRGTIDPDAGGCTPPPSYESDEETCDGLDNDCDGEVDEGLLKTFYRDNDDDGFGTGETREACDAPDGFAAEPGDCDDESAATNPDAAPKEEPEAGCYKDLDEDGWGDVSPADGVDPGEDCNDADADIHPENSEYFADPRPDGTYNYDCDGDENEKKWLNTNPSCNEQIGNLCTLTQGWKGSEVPGCGESGKLMTECNEECENNPSFCYCAGGYTNTRQKCQ